MIVQPPFVAGREFHANAVRLTQAVEFRAYAYPIAGALAALLPVAPGAALRDGMGRCEVLHFAPGCWLVPAPTARLAALLAAATATGEGMSIGVAGKWQGITIAGPGAQRAMTRTAALDAILDGRECAALELFDCPAIIARSSVGFDLWTQASYSADLMASLQSA
jgi:heterotetrameric sarcosine oxidase gamma subunit